MLDKICNEKRVEIAARRAQRSLADVEAAARNNTSAPRGFRNTLANRAASGYGLITEIKKTSPSKGVIRADFDPPALAAAYANGGAACLSVLTQGPYFQGCDEDLVAARAAVDIPVLRKDFMLDAFQVFEARELGADCILLIMAALDDTTATELETIAIDLDMDVLVEVHNEGELDRASPTAKPALSAVNNRDLTTLSVDLATTETLVSLMPQDTLVVSESGLSTPADLARMAAVGVRCFLVGEALMRQADVAAATVALLDTANPVAISA